MKQKEWGGGRGIPILMIKFIIAERRDASL